MRECNLQPLGYPLDGRQGQPCRREWDITPLPEGRPASSRALRLAGVALLFVLPLALRLAPVGHGLPRNYVPDTHVVRCALGMARDRDPVPPVDRYSSYPYLLPYLLLPVYAGHFAVGLAAGEWSGPAEYGDAVSEEPATVHLLARLLVALFGALTPWVVYRTARAAGLSRGAWVAAFLVGTGLLHVHFSVQERPWVPMVFFMALAAWPAARYAERASPRLLALSGLCAGLAFATHTAGLLALGIPGLAWLLALRGRRGAELARHAASGAAAVLAFGAVSLLFGHPYFLVHGLTPAEAVVGGDAGDISFGGQSHRFGLRFASVLRLSRAFAGYDPALLLLALPGILLALRSHGARAATLFALIWAAYFLPQENDHVRYLLPLSVLLALPAGFAAEAWLARGRGALVALALLLAFPLVQSLRLGRVLARPDTRAAAEVLVPELLPTGARLAVDRYGPVFDPDLASLELLASLRERRGEALYTRERHRAERLRAGAPLAPGIGLLNVHELFDFDERAGTVAVASVLSEAGSAPPGGDAPEVLRARLESLGVTHLLLVSRTPFDPLGSLLAPLAAGREPLLVLDPGRGGRRPPEARLPMEMEFPLTALWHVDRPGPWMALYALR